MKIVNSAILWKEQYKIFNFYLKYATSAQGIKYIYSDCNVDDLHDEDLLILPPYGDVVNLIRNNRFIPRCKTIMVDLKGPAGIDSAIMISKNLDSFHYCSPMIGDSSYQQYYLALHSNNIPIYPLPYFPSYKTLINSHIINNFTNRPNKIKYFNRAFYAGSVWGDRKKYLYYIKELFNKKILIKNNLNTQKYCEYISNSLVSLDIGGTEACTYRFAEIMLLSSLCLSQRRPFFMLESAPIDGQHIVCFSTEDELSRKLENIFSNHKYFYEMSMHGYEWYINTQNPIKYLSYLLGIIEHSSYKKILPVNFSTNDFPNSFWTSY